MTEEYRQQFTEYLIREIARRVVPMSLEATGDAGCIARAKALRGLADNASMTEVGRSCTAAADAAYAAWASAADIAVRIATYAAVRAADAAYDSVRAAVHNAQDHAEDHAADAAYVAGGEVARKEYDAILIEAKAILLGVTQ